MNNGSETCHALLSDCVTGKVRTYVIIVITMLAFKLFPLTCTNAAALTTEDGSKTNLRSAIRDVSKRMPPPNLHMWVSII